MRSEDPIWKMHGIDKDKLLAELNLRFEER